MTPDEQLEAIERDRRKRERELLLLLLLIVGGGRRYILHAIADGHAIPLPNLPTLAPAMARAMADAHVSGMWRAGEFAGVPVIPRGVVTEDLPQYQAAVKRYRPAAEAAALYIAGRLKAVADAAVAESGASELSPAETLKFVRDAYTYYGWTARKPETVNPSSTADAAYAIAGHATDAVLSAYAAGNWEGFQTPAVWQLLTGFGHHSIVDNRTSKYCDPDSGRVGLMLPASHPYWLHNWPPLHRRCRSAAVPIFGPFEMSKNLPVVPPAPGFGLSPGFPFGAAA